MLFMFLLAGLHGVRRGRPAPWKNVAKEHKRFCMQPEGERGNFLISITRNPLKRLVSKK
jgi:hypothetical protein